MKLQDIQEARYIGKNAVTKKDVSSMFQHYKKIAQQITQDTGLEAKAERTGRTKWKQDPVRYGGHAALHIILPAEIGQPEQALALAQELEHKYSIPHDDEKHGVQASFKHIYFLFSEPDKQLQEARHHNEHPMIDEIKQAASGRRYYERKITDVDAKDVIAMITRHFGEPALTRERRTFWNMGNDELSVADYPDYVQVYLA